MAREIEARFGYDLGQLVSDIRYSYEYDETCQGSVPEAIVCFLDSISYEDAIRNAVSLGGDSDTLASIAGAIAGAYYGVPHQIIGYVNSRLPEELRGVLSAFDRLDPI
jgi:ADP-ribosylglycohydrolase